MSPAKHSCASVTDGQADRRTDRQTDRQTDRRTDDGKSYPYVSLCFASDTKSVVRSGRGAEEVCFQTHMILCNNWLATSLKRGGGMRN